MPVRVDGWRNAAYRHRDAAARRAPDGTALLSPFDPLVWERGRTERLFGFRYRIEIYTPAPKRQFGYYVLPFLMDGRLVGRVCLKADRHAGVLRVNASHHEEGADSGAAAERLAGELVRLAAWLGLDDIVVHATGTLAKPLRQAIPRAA